MAGALIQHASALVRSGWLQRLGRGAYSLPGDELNRDACLAFRETVLLWGDQPARLPAWFRAWAGSPSRWPA